MEIEFKSTITIYECFALIISVFALILPGLITAWKYFFVKTKLKIYPTNQIKLLYNESGSYINIDFSIECKNKSTVIKNIETEIIRKADNKKLELTQTTFRSPSYAVVGNQWVTNNEIAHPMKIDKDELKCIFVEEGQKNGETINKLKEIHENKMNNFTFSNNYENDIKIFKSKPDYTRTYSVLFEELFWKKSDYVMTIIISYGDYSKFKKTFEFEIDEDEEMLFVENVEKALNCRIGNAYNIKTIFYFGNKDYK